MNISEDSEASNVTIAPTVNHSRPRNVVNAQVAAALDRTKMSDRNAVYALSSFTQAVGQDPNRLALNRWSIRRSRMKHRNETMARAIRAQSRIRPRL